MFNKEKPVTVNVNKEKCTKCGICFTSCDNYLEKDEQGYPKAKNLEDSLLGCIQCGECMMRCPSQAIEIVGEDIDNSHLVDYPHNIADFNQLNSLFLKRRSCREYEKQEVSNEDIEKILSAASTAAVGLPPSEVKVTVIKGYQQVNVFRELILDELRHMQKIMTPFALSLMKNFMSANKYKELKDFVVPLVAATLDKDKEGIDLLLYDAPAVVIFNGIKDFGDENSIIASTHATIAAEALGLGTCFIGSIPYIINNSDKLRRKYGVEKGEKASIAFILGVPKAVKRYKTFKRNFREIKIIE